MGMKKKSLYTNITPIPSHIPRQLAIDVLHSHGEIIKLNPLVIEHHPINALRSAPSDEYFSQWYEITERIQYIPGTGKMGSGKITFKGVFHDMPWGLQTHIYAPMGVDLRNKWQVRGNQQGEPPEPRELGSGAPAEGLYLREDVEIRCNITMISFVKKELKAASKVLVERLVRKAELLDAGVLQAMMENGRLKTVNPALLNLGSPGRSTYPSQPLSPDLDDEALKPDGFSPQNSPIAPYHVLRKQEDDRRRTMHQDQPQYGNGKYSAPESAYTRQSHYNHGQIPPSQGLAIEMPSDFYHAHRALDHLQSPNRNSTYSELSASSPTQKSSPLSASGSDYQSTPASTTSRFSSDAPDGGAKSPGLQHEQKSFAAELPTRDFPGLSPNPQTDYGGVVSDIHAG
jgi:hypothetical protein